MDVRGGWFGFQKVLTQKVGKARSGLDCCQWGTLIGGGLRRLDTYSR